jgi:hypothetical protein
LNLGIILVLPTWAAAQSGDGLASPAWSPYLVGGGVGAAVYGDVGKLTWYQLFHLRPLAFVAVFAPALVAALAVLHVLVDPLP